jgi:hypothetical protein
MAARKTVDLAWLTDQVNTRLAIPDSSRYLRAPGKDRDMTPEEAARLELASLLECVLMHTGAYKGFGYQDGVVPHPEAGRAEWGDETRRIYYHS